MSEDKEFTSGKQGDTPKWMVPFEYLDITNRLKEYEKRTKGAEILLPKFDELIYGD